MTKGELLRFLEPFDDDIEIFMIDCLTNRQYPINSLIYCTSGDEDVILIEPSTIIEEVT